MPVMKRYREVPEIRVGMPIMIEDPRGAWVEYAEARTLLTSATDRILALEAECERLRERVIAVEAHAEAAADWLRP